MLNIIEHVKFLKSVSKKVEEGLLVDDEISVSFGNFELEHVNELISYLETNKDENDSLEKKSSNLNLPKMPIGFFDNPLTLTSKDLIGLPEELRAELSNLDETEAEILQLFEIAKSEQKEELVLDKVIAGLFYLTGKTYQRQVITAKMYKMSKKALIYSVPKKKGVYTTRRSDEI